MSPTPQRYRSMAKAAMPRSHLLRNLLCAFAFGGAICTLGQLCLDGYALLGLDKPDASSLTSVTLIALSALLTGLNIFDRAAKIGGAGTLVPITGFANAVVSPALEFRTEGLVMGVGAKLFSIAGPVIVYGVAASVVYGIVLWVVSLFA